MREFKAIVGFGKDNKVVSIEPLKKSDSIKAIDFTRLTVRLLTDNEVDREVVECMVQDCHAYKREHNRVKQVR